MYNFNDKTVLITGATGSIGQEIARQFGLAEATLLLHGNKNVEKLEQLACEINTKNNKVHTFIADFHRQNDLEKFIFDITTNFPSVDTLINTAGLNLMSPEMSQTTFDKRLESILNLDVLATIRLSRRICDTMLKQGRGTIFFFGWDGVDYGWHGETAQLYGTAKGAIQGYARSLAETVSPQIRIRSISLGWIKTNWGKPQNNNFINRVKSDSLTQRLGEPREIAETVMFLTSESANYFDGINIRLNGGKRGTKFNSI
ncbi:MAG: SDR family oxidoreductase [Planctomycetaceae bacterium]|jgi:3-oxoacyl-[acyl-carrier protein] reductase|nr:SDR family oxidoreductase [Planctomycetaceae bacterium]